MEKLDSALWSMNWTLLLVSIFHHLKILLRKISSFLSMVTVNGCFLLFFDHNQTHRTTKAQPTRPQKQTVQILFLLKPNSHLPKKISYLLHRKPFKNDEKCFFFFLMGIHSMQSWTATTRHGVTRKSIKRIKHTGNLFRMNLQLIDVC